MWRRVDLIQVKQNYAGISVNKKKKHTGFYGNIVSPTALMVRERWDKFGTAASGVGSII